MGVACCDSSDTRAVVDTRNLNLSIKAPLKPAYIESAMDGDYENSEATTPTVVEVEKIVAFKTKEIRKAAGTPKAASTVEPVDEKNEIEGITMTSVLDDTAVTTPSVKAEKESKEVYAVDDFA